MAEQTNMLDIPMPVQWQWAYRTEDAYRQPPAAEIISTIETVVDLSAAHLGLIETAIHEAIVNAIVHGNLELGAASEEFGDGNLKAFEAFYQGINERLKQPDLANRSIEVSAVYENSALVVSVTDSGNGFTETAPDSRPRNSGRGLLVIRSVADEVSYDLGGRRVTMVFHP